MSEQTEKQEPPSPTACQKCGADKVPMGVQFQKREGTRFFAACMCDGCTMEFYGLDWRETKPPPLIYIPGVQPGARPA